MNDKKEIYGLIGHPVKHSLSAAMHNAAFSHLGINAEYKLFDVSPEDLEDFLLNDVEVEDIQGNKIRSKDIVCFNITVPHKVNVTKILMQKFPVDIYACNQTNLEDAILTGAVNTVKRNNDKLEYWNTDAGGFVESLEKDLNINLGNQHEKVKDVMLFGCGGAGRAVITGLSWKQNKIDKIFVYEPAVQVIDSFKMHIKTLPSKLQNMLNDKIEFITELQISEKIQDVQLLINASPVGMHEGDGSIIDKNLLHDGLSIYDVIYNRNTQLVEDAKSLNLSAVGGKGMLLYQGTRAFGLWTNINVWMHPKNPGEKMREVLEKALKV
ncbi:MAG: shikimate dehydrogenase [PVC group bacterium]|nr:shikimate dehydrogenase [PVC group bacterium]